MALGSANQRKGLFSHILGPFPKKLRKCNSLRFTDLFWLSGLSSQWKVRVHTSDGPVLLMVTWLGGLTAVELYLESRQLAVPSS